MSVFDGGADDLIQWRIEINDLMEPMRGIDGRPTYVRRQPDAELTLFRIDQEECEAVIALINEMRSRTRSISEPPVKPGNRFAGLEFE